MSTYMAKKGETVAVRGMMPKNSLSRNSLSRLHIYADANFEQQAQKPEAYAVD